MVEKVRTFLGETSLHFKMWGDCRMMMNDENLESDTYPFHSGMSIQTTSIQSPMGSDQITFQCGIGAHALRGSEPAVAETSALSH